jgi:hypothetical protein
MAAALLAQALHAHAVFDALDAATHWQLAVCACALSHPALLPQHACCMPSSISLYKRSLYMYLLGVLHAQQWHGTVLHSSLAFGSTTCTAFYSIDGV